MYYSVQALNIIVTWTWFKTFTRHFGSTLKRVEGCNLIGSQPMMTYADISCYNFGKEICPGRSSSESQEFDENQEYPSWAPDHRRLETPRFQDESCDPRDVMQHQSLLPSSHIY